MREKRPALVITFPTTAAAMGCETPVSYTHLTLPTKA